MHRPYALMATLFAFAAAPGLSHGQVITDDLSPQKPIPLGEMIERMRLPSGQLSNIPATVINYAPEPSISADPRTDWSLGKYGAAPRYAAADLYPPGQTVGWYSNVGVSILKPNLKDMLTTPAAFTPTSPTGNPIALPAGSLDWTASPEISIGYRLGQGAGDLLFTYRLLASSGTTSLPGLDPPLPATMRTRLDVQTIDIDYISSEYLSEAKDVSRWFFRDLRAGVGMRVASTFFDSQATGAVQLPDTHVSSSFGGLGPRFLLALNQDLGRPDFQFYTRVTASAVVGPIRQRFTQTVLTGSGPDFTGYDTRNQATGMGILQAQAGFAWEPDALSRRLRLSLAYTWERWWDFGNTNDSNAELTLQGVMLRAEYHF